MVIRAECKSMYKIKLSGVKRHLCCSFQIYTTRWSHFNKYCKYFCREHDKLLYLHSIIHLWACWINLINNKIVKYSVQMRDWGRPLWVWESEGKKDGGDVWYDSNERVVHGQVILGAFLLWSSLARGSTEDSKASKIKMMSPVSSDLAPVKWSLIWMRQQRICSTGRLKENANSLSNGTWGRLGCPKLISLLYSVSGSCDFWPFLNLKLNLKNRFMGRTEIQHT